MDDLVHPDTPSVDMPYLDIFNYGALYRESVTDDLLYPDTTLINITYTAKKLTPKSNLIQKFESTICFIVESIRIRVD